MQTRDYFLTVLLAALLSGTADSASAEIILTTDKPEYEVGEIVHITAHNAGPMAEDFVSDPHFIIWNQDTDKCVFGCVGLPVVTPFPVGETVSMDWDTGSSPDDPGNYIVRVAVIDGPSVSYVLTVKVDADRNSWSILKVLYRS
jgi:hypothetical protein